MMSWIEFVEKASFDVVKEGMVDIKANYFPHHKFLSDENPLRFNTIENVQNHFNQNNPDFEIASSAAKSYLAASSVLHLIDGWHYLSSSINALLSGDITIAIHLAYYAELRATSSFLASEGIGVFNNKHFCLSIDSEIIKDPYSQKTHVFVWNVINKWAESSKESNILNYFKYNGLSFKDWISFIPHSNSERVSPLFVKEWLTKWCVDIRELEKDRDARNFLSYRPCFDRLAQHSKLNEIGRTINSFWRILEPNETNRFASIDKYLFSIFLKRIYETIQQAEIDYSMDQLIEETYSNAGKSIDLSLKSILSLNSEHILLEKAKKKTKEDNNEITDPFAIISRAILMLRVATGSTSYLLKSANVTKEELKFYINRIGIDGGLWDMEEMPVDFCDLWTDIANLMVDFEDSFFDSDLTLKKLNDNHFSISTYSQFNRVAVWGLDI